MRGFWIVLLLGFIGSCNGQPPARPTKILTPEQQKYQQQLTEWRQRRDHLRTAAQTALAAETAREKTGDCPNATTTRDQVDCLNAEGDETQANYAAFAGAIRAMLVDAVPDMAGTSLAPGPTGVPLTADQRVAEFDGLETEAKTYREHAASAAYNEYKGGTLAPVFSLEASQRMLRLHMQELAFIYGEELSNH